MPPCKDRDKWIIEPDLAAPRPEPAVSIKQSVKPEYILCLEDGKKNKMLKRHLKTAHGMTPDDYRKRWGLPGDYPLVSPNYAKQRSELAKKIGLGRKPETKMKARRKTKNPTKPKKLSLHSAGRSQSGVRPLTPESRPSIGNVRFCADCVCSTPNFGRSRGRSRESVVDPKPTYGR